MSTSPETSPPVKPQSELGWRASSEFDTSLSCGASLLRPMAKRMVREGLPVETVRRLYLSAVEARQAVMAASGYPPLKVPTWEELDPAQPA